MSIRSIAVVFLALVCGATAALGVSRLRQPQVAGAAQNVETMPVVVAAADVERGRMIGSEDIVVRNWPKDSVPAGTITKVEDALERSTKARLIAGEPLFEAKLASKDAGRGLAALVPSDMRAYTIQAKGVAANVAGFILPGNRVDVLLTLKEGCALPRSAGTTNLSSTLTLLQAVEILAVGDQMNEPDENKFDTEKLHSVTLLVTPQQAAKLDLAQTLGSLTLSLRNLEDTHDALVGPTTIESFFPEAPVILDEEGKPSLVHKVGTALMAAMTKDRPAEKEPTEPAVCGIVTLRGNQRGYQEVRRP